MSLNENFGRALKNDDVLCRMEDDTAGEIQIINITLTFKKDLVRLLHDTADNHQFVSRFGSVLQLLVDHELCSNHNITMAEATMKGEDLPKVSFTSEIGKIPVFLL